MRTATPDRSSLQVAAGLAVLAVSLGATLIVSAFPLYELDAVPWLMPLGASLVAAGGAAALLAALAHGLRTGAGASLVAGAGMAVLGGTYALHALGATAAGAAMPSMSDALGTFLAAVLVLCAAVIGPSRLRTSSAAVPGVALIAVFVLVELALAAVAVVAPGAGRPMERSAVHLLAATLLAVSAALDSRSGRAAFPIALLAVAALAQAIVRPGSADGLVPLATLSAGTFLFAASTARDMAAVRPPSATAPERRAESPHLPPLAHALRDGAFLFDADLRLVDRNLAGAAMLRIGPETRGMTPAEVFGPALERPWSLVPAGGRGHLRVEVQGRPLELALIGQDDELLVMARDLGPVEAELASASRLTRELRGTIEELERARRTIELQRGEIEHAASIDPLTAVASRRAIMERLRTEVAEARRYDHPLVVLLLDVDGIGAVNHEHGMAAGDEVLREIALRMRLRMREADALGRVDGDAFLAILPHTEERGAAVFADVLRRRIAAARIGTDAGELQVTVSIGVAVLHAGMQVGAEDLLVSAEEALTSARSAGGDRIAFDRAHGLARLERRSDEGPDSPRTTQHSGT